MELKIFFAVLFFDSISKKVIKTNSIVKNSKFQFFQDGGTAAAWIAVLPDFSTFFCPRGKSLEKISYTFPKNPKKIPKNPKKSQKIPKNLKKSQKIPKNPKKSQKSQKCLISEFSINPKKISKNPKKSQKSQKISKIPETPKNL